jgi:hypothetical protein
LIVSAYEGMAARAAKIPAPSRPLLAQATQRVIQLYGAWGKPEKVHAWKVKLGMSDLPADVFTRP